jgi:hypothetical protein
LPELYIADAHAAPYFGTGLSGAIEYHLLHGGMKEIQSGETLGRGSSKVARRESKGMEERLFVSAGFAEAIVESEPLDFRDTPRRHRFTADTVFERNFALGHEYAQSLPGEDRGETRTAKSTTDRDHVVVICWHIPAPAHLTRSRRATFYIMRS